MAKKDREISAHWVAYGMMAVMFLWLLLMAKLK